MDFPPCPRTKNFVAHSAHHPHLHLSLSLSLSLSLPPSLLPLLYFSFLSKRRKSLVLTFSPPPPPPPPPLPIHHSAFGSPIPVVSSTTPCAPVCAVFVVCVGGRLLPTLQILYQLHFQFVAKIRFLFLCVFFCLGLIKLTPFFCFLSFVMACL